MRFVLDAQNFLGIVGMAFGAGLGWAAGTWLMHRLLSAIKV